MYVVYDPETGEVLSITSTEPDDLTNCLVTSATLTGDPSDYVVQNGRLYPVQRIRELEYITDTPYFIVYDNLGIVTSVETSQPSDENTNYIRVANDPGAIVGKQIRNISEYLANSHGKGYVSSLDDLPTSGNTEGDFYILRGTYGTAYLWDGDEWNVWSPDDARLKRIYVSSSDELPTSGMQVGDIYYEFNRDEATLTDYEWNGSSWDSITTTLVAIPRGTLLSGNSFYLLGAEIVSEPAGTPTSDTQNTIGSSITSLGADQAGQDVIVSITLTAGNWAVRDVEGSDETEETEEEVETNEDVPTRSMVYVIASDYIRHNTILQITSINRGALRGDISWSCSDGYITFQTEYGLDPYEDVEIYGVLHSTTDSWAALGSIDAWPQGEWRKVQYQQSVHVPNWSVDIRAGDSLLIETPLDMTFARLLYIAPEWCGNTHAMLSQYYVGSGNNRLYLRITNLAQQPIRINDILLSIIYSGNIVNFIAPNGLAEEDSTSTVSSEGATDTYITDEDIDEVT